MNSVVFLVIFFFVCTRVVSSGGDTIESSCMPPEFSSSALKDFSEIPELSESSSSGYSPSLVPDVPSRSDFPSSSQQELSGSSSSTDLNFVMPQNLDTVSDEEKHEKDRRDNDNHDTIVNVYVNNQIITNTNSSVVRKRSDVKEIRQKNVNPGTANTKNEQRNSSDKNNFPGSEVDTRGITIVGNDTDTSNSAAVNDSPSKRPKNKRLGNGRDKKKTEDDKVGGRSDTENAANNTTTNNNSTESVTGTSSGADTSAPSSSVIVDAATSQSPSPSSNTRGKVKNRKRNCSETDDKALPVFHSVLSNATDEQSRCIDLLVGIDLELLTPQLLVFNLSVDYNRCVDAILQQYSHLLLLLSDILGIPLDDVIELAYDLLDGKTVKKTPEACVADELEQNTSALQKILDNLLNILKTVVLNLKVDLKLLGLDLKVDVMVLKYSKLLELNLELNAPALERQVKNLLGDKVLKNENLRKIQAKGNVHKLLDTDDSDGHLLG